MSGPFALLHRILGGGDGRAGDDVSLAIAAEHLHDEDHRDDRKERDEADAAPSERAAERIAEGSVLLTAGSFRAVTN